MRGIGPGEERSIEISTGCQAGPSGSVDVIKCTLGDETVDYTANCLGVTGALAVTVSMCSLDFDAFTVGQATSCHNHPGPVPLIRSLPPE
jgi:hypothetical protein